MAVSVHAWTGRGRAGLAWLLGVSAEVPTGPLYPDPHSSPCCLLGLGLPRTSHSCACFLSLARATLAWPCLPLPYLHPESLASWGAPSSVTHCPAFCPSPGASSHLLWGCSCSPLDWTPMPSPCPGHRLGSGNAMCRHMQAWGPQSASAHPAQEPQGCSCSTARHKAVSVQFTEAICPGLSPHAQQRALFHESSCGTAKLGDGFP